MRKSIFLALAIGFVSFFALASGAMAAQDTGTLNVNANVQSVARITSITDINFGNYDPTSLTDLDADGDVSVRATKGLAYNIYIGSDRVMTDGTDNLNYELYVDAGRTTAWGSTLATAENYTSAGNAISTKNIHGRVPALQDVQAGAYSDTVLITLEF